MNDELVKEQKITKYYKITARNQGQMNMVDKLFCLIEYLGKIGASRNINLYVDGDGMVQLKFQSCKADENIFRDLDYDLIRSLPCGYGYEKIELNSGDDKSIIIDLG